MLRLRPRLGILATLTLVLAAPAASCTKNNPGTNVKLAGDGEPGAIEVGGSGADDAGNAGPGQRGPIAKISVRASVTGVGDMLDAGTKLLNMWVPPEPGAPALNLRTEVADTLVDSGFAPGFFESVDLDGVHVVDAGIPQDGQPGVTDADLDLAAVLSSIDGQRTLDGLPTPLRPQPMGDGLWQLVDQSVSLFFRPKADGLEVAGMRVENLDVAAGLRGQVKTGADVPRLNFRVTDLPALDIDVSELLPLPDPLARPLSAIISELTAAELAADFGTDRDLIISAGADAPFERLGLGPIGAPMTQPSELAKALPADAMLTWMMPWGDPKLLHELIDNNVPVDQIPAPFDTYVGDVLAGTHEILDLIEGEVIVSAYVDKGKVSLVLAGKVRDEAKTRKATRALFDAAIKATSDHLAIVGNSPNHKYSVSFKRDAIKVGSARGDLFKLELPKDLHDEAEKLAWLFDAKKPRLEVGSVVVDGKLIVAIGVGQQATMAAIGRGRGDGLEAGGGLALARKISNGCQYCIAADPVELGEMLFTVIAADPTEAKQVRDAATKALASLAKLGLDGELALGLRLAEGQGMLGFGVPKQLLFADPAKIKTIVELMDSLDEAEQAAWEAEAAGKPR